ncbi:MAG: hypothetical protein JXP34_24280 [Planctomycetes bacterium]|nr:hypothetical protein [Planctomycetota bacterium]
MAIRDTCPHCGHAICVPESMRGERVPCPECGQRTVLRTEAERRRDEERRVGRAEARQRDLERIALLERLESERPAGAPDAPPPIFPAIDPAASPIPRRRRLRVLADLTLLAAYVVATLCIAGAGLTIYLGFEGAIVRPTVVAVACLGWAVVGVFGFAALKYAGELGLLVGEIGDGLAALRRPARGEPPSGSPPRQAGPPGAPRG